MRSQQVWNSSPLLPRYFHPQALIRRHALKPCLRRLLAAFPWSELNGRLSPSPFSIMRSRRIVVLWWTLGLPPVRLCPVWGSEAVTISIQLHLPTKPFWISWECLLIFPFSLFQPIRVTPGVVQRIRIARVPVSWHPCYKGPPPIMYFFVITFIFFPEPPPAAEKTCKPHAAIGFSAECEFCLSICEMCNLAWVLSVGVLFYQDIKNVASVCLTP